MTSSAPSAPPAAAAPAGDASIAGRWLRLSLHQRLAWLYCLLFAAVVVLTNAPGLADAQGRNLGVFVIDPLDNVVHSVSGLWAAYAAWRSPRAARFYFRAFGLFYTADAFVGLFTGYAIPEFLLHWSAVPGYAVTDGFVTNVLANLPHFVIGPVALAIGFALPIRSPAVAPRRP